MSRTENIKKSLNEVSERLCEVDSLLSGLHVALLGPINCGVGGGEPVSSDDFFGNVEQRISQLLIHAESISITAHAIRSGAFGEDANIHGEARPIA